MKTTLKQTIELSQSGVITNYHEVSDITLNMIKVPFEKLEAASRYFDFVRTFTFTEMNENTFKDLNFIDILAVADVFRDDVSEDGARYLYLHRTALGLLDAVSVPEARMFCSASVFSYMRCFAFSDYVTLTKMTREYIDLNITPDTSIGCLLKKIRLVINSPWRVDQDIEYYRKNIVGCGEILDLLLIKSLKQKYPKLFY